MSLKKKLFFSRNNEKTTEEKIISLPIKTGDSVREVTDREIEEEILLNKFIRCKMFPSCIIVDSKDDTLYFENEKMYDLLKNNQSLNRLRNPKCLLDSIEYLIVDIDEQLIIITKYIPKLSFLEKCIIDMIEEFRCEHDPYWYVLFDNLSSLRKLINHTSYATYHVLLDIYYDIYSLRSKALSDSQHLFKTMMDFNKVFKTFEEINKPIEVVSRVHRARIKLDDSHNTFKIEKIYDYVSREYYGILDLYGIEIQ